MCCGLAALDFLNGLLGVFEFFFKLGVVSHFENLYRQKQSIEGISNYNLVRALLRYAFFWNLELYYTRTEINQYDWEFDLECYSQGWRKRGSWEVNSRNMPVACGKFIQCKSLESLNMDF